MPRNLWFAAGREEQRLAFVNQICIVDGGIGVRKAGPVGSAAKMGPGDLGEGIALLNDDACGRAESRRYRRQEKVRACHDVVGIHDSRICSDQIVPPETLAKMLLRELPKGVAGLHSDRVQFHRAAGCGTYDRGRLRWRNWHDRRSGLGRSYAKNRRLRRRRTNHGRYRLRWRHANRGCRRRHHAKVRPRSGRLKRGR